MFDNLSDRLTAAARSLTGKGRLTEANIKDTMRQVRLALLEADVAVTINSDDPTPFNCSLAEEFRTLAEYPSPSMEELTLRAIEVSWMSDEEQSRHRSVVTDYWQGADGL